MGDPRLTVKEVIRYYTVEELKDALNVNTNERKAILALLRTARHLEKNKPKKGAQ